MFIGEYTHSLDVKGRLAVPAKFRAELERGAVVTRGIDQCLVLYTLKEWNALAEKISQLPMNHANTRSLSRLLLAGAMDVQIDKQGRIIIPDYLRKYAGIGKKAVVAGLYNKIEIWDEGTWEQNKSQTESESQQIAETLNGFGV
jgi:MraZ protein